MTDRPWHSLGHMVRMLVADLSAAMVAVALLVCNFHGDRGLFLRPTAKADTPGIEIQHESRAWAHGWPLVCLTRFGLFSGGRVYSYQEAISLVPQPGNVKEHWELDFKTLTIDVLVALVILVSTAHATRRWLRTETTWFQVSLFSLLMLPTIPVLVFLFVEPPGLVPSILLTGFFWLGMLCTVYVTALAIFGLWWRLLRCFTKGNPSQSQET